MAKSHVTFSTFPSGTTILYGEVKIVDTPSDRFVRILPETDKRRIEKEIRGLEAKSRWTHVSTSVVKGYQARIGVLRAELESA
jgi:hypothetical protein